MGAFGLFPFFLFLCHTLFGVNENTRTGSGMHWIQSGWDVIPFISRNRMLPLCCRLDTCQGTSIVWCGRVPSCDESHRFLSRGKSNWNLRMKSCRHIIGLTVTFPDISASKQTRQKSALIGIRLCKFVQLISEDSLLVHKRCENR